MKKNNLPLVISHRGSSTLLPENTLEALEHSVKTEHADMIEFDLRITKDGIPVVFHDAKLDRTTNGSGYLAHYSLSEIKKLDAGYCFDPKRNRAFPCRNQNFRVPTFEELLKRLPDVSLAVEIKENSDSFVHTVVKLLDHYNRRGHSVVGSKFHEVSKTMEKDYPDIPRFCSKKDVIGMWLDYRRGNKTPKPEPKMVASLPVNYCGIPFESQGLIEFLHRKKMKVYYWTVDDPKTMRMLKQNGADGIITNIPAFARKTLTTPA